MCYNKIKIISSRSPARPESPRLLLFFFFLLHVYIHKTVVLTLEALLNTHTHALVQLLRYCSCSE